MTYPGDILADTIGAGVAEGLRNNGDRHSKWRTGTVISLVDPTSTMRQVEVKIDGDPEDLTTKMRSVNAVEVGQRVLVVYSAGGGVWCLGALGGKPDEVVPAGDAPATVLVPVYRQRWFAVEQGPYAANTANDLTDWTEEGSLNAAPVVWDATNEWFAFTAPGFWTVRADFFITRAAGAQITGASANMSISNTGGGSDAATGPYVEHTGSAHWHVGVNNTGFFEPGDIVSVGAEANGTFGSTTWNVEASIMFENWAVADDITAGLVGPAGPPGPTGASGGVPVGGGAGQALVKASATDLDVEWATVSGGGGGGGLAFTDWLEVTDTYTAVAAGSTIGPTSWSINDSGGTAIFPVDAEEGIGFLIDGYYSVDIYCRISAVVGGTLTSGRVGISSPSGSQGCTGAPGVNSAGRSTYEVTTNWTGYAPGYSGGSSFNLSARGVGANFDVTFILHASLLSAGTRP